MANKETCWAKFWEWVDCHSTLHFIFSNGFIVQFFFFLIIFISAKMWMLVVLNCHISVRLFNGSIRNKEEK